MPTPLTREDLFDYNVKCIFRELAEEYEEDIEEYAEEAATYGTTPLALWLERNHSEVGEKFINRVTEYMGIDDAIAEALKERVR